MVCGGSGTSTLLTTIDLALFRLAGDRRSTAELLLLLLLLHLMILSDMILGQGQLSLKSWRPSDNREPSKGCIHGQTYDHQG